MDRSLTMFAPLCIVLTNTVYVNPIYFYFFHIPYDYYVYCLILLILLILPLSQTQLNFICAQIHIHHNVQLYVHSVLFQNLSAICFKLIYHHL